MTDRFDPAVADPRWQQRWADAELLRRSRLMNRLLLGAGGIGDLGYVGIGELYAAGACPRGLRRGKPRRTRGTVGRSAVAGSWWNTRWRGCAGSAPWRT